MGFSWWRSSTTVCCVAEEGAGGEVHGEFRGWGLGCEQESDLSRGFIPDASFTKVLTARRAVSMLSFRRRRRKRRRRRRRKMNKHGLIK